MSLAECQELRKIQLEEEQIIDGAEYNAEWDKLPEDVQDKLSQEQIEQHYMINPEEHKKKMEENNEKFKKHLLSCNHHDCKRVKQNWINMGYLKE